MGNPTKLIRDYHQRAARAQEKARLILNFLRDECWTTTEITARLLNIDPVAALRTLHQMQREHYLKSEDMVLYIRNRGSGRYIARKTILWGISPHGLAHAFDLNEEMIERPTFELGRTHPAYVEHHIGVQRLRLAAETCGWRQWCPGKLLMNTGLDKVPDAEAIDPNGARVAIEFEREIKTLKRYTTILATYLVALGNKRWQRVEYVCPTADLAARLKRVMYSIKEALYTGKQTPYSGQRMKVTERLLDNRITFSGMDAWPSARAVDVPLSTEDTTSQENLLVRER